MKTENSALMKMARESLRGNWGVAIGTFLVYSLIIGILPAIPVLGLIVLLVITAPLVLGLMIFTLSLSRKENASLGQLFQGFNNFGSALGASLLIGLFTFLWSLLLIIPGIIATLSYSMTFFILADNSSIGPMEAIKKSKEMMNGNKWKLFCLGFRFVGWSILSVFTAGIGTLWLIPYTYVSMAKFYDDIKITNE